MSKSIFGNIKITRDIYGNPLSKKNKREPVYKSQKNEVLARQRNKCATCRKLLDMRYTHIDHVKEVYKGGTSSISNLQALCANCHNIKTHEDKLKKIEQKRKATKSSNDAYFINHITGKKEKPINIFRL